MENDRFLKFLGLTKKAGHLIEGYNKCEDAVKKINIYLFIISNEASQNTREKFLRYCEEFKIPNVQGYSSDELGSAIGRPQINILGVTDMNMGEKLISLCKPL